MEVNNPAGGSPFINLEDYSDVQFVSSIHGSAGEGGGQIFSRSVAEDEVVIITGVTVSGESGENPLIGLEVNIDGHTFSTGTGYIGGSLSDIAFAGIPAHNSVSADWLESGADSGGYNLTYLVITK